MVKWIFMAIKYQKKRNFMHFVCNITRFCCWSRWQILSTNIFRILKECKYAVKKKNIINTIKEKLNLD